MRAESLPTPSVSPASPAPGEPIRPAAGRPLPEGVRVLRGHLVQRVPTKRERATRPGLALTARDEDLLVAVYDHGLLPTELLELAFFPPASASAAAPVPERRRARDRSACAADRLRRLWLWGYLERVEQPVAPALGGRRPYLYAIGPRAVPVLTARLGATARAVHRRRLDRLDDRALGHDLQAARLWATLTASLPETRLTGFRWEAERSLRARRLRVRLSGDPALPFLPDGYAELDYPDGSVQGCVVEVDAGTLPLRRFKRKLRAFEGFLEQGLFARHFGRDAFEVLVLAPSAARRRHLHAAAREVVPEDRWDSYLFATPEALAPQEFPDGWWSLDEDDDGEACGLFFNQAFEAGAFGPGGRTG